MQAIELEVETIEEPVEEAVVVEENVIDTTVDVDTPVTKLSGINKFRKASKMIQTNLALQKVLEKIRKSKEIDEDAAGEATKEPVVVEENVIDTTLDVDTNKKNRDSFDIAFGSLKAAKKFKNLLHNRKHYSDSDEDNDENHFTHDEEESSALVTEQLTETVKTETTTNTPVTKLSGINKFRKASKMIQTNLALQKVLEKIRSSKEIEEKAKATKSAIKTSSPTPSMPTPTIKKEEEKPVAMSNTGNLWGTTRRVTSFASKLRHRATTTKRRAREISEDDSRPQSTSVKLGHNEGGKSIGISHGNLGGWGDNDTDTDESNEHEHHHDDHFGIDHSMFYSDSDSD